MQFIVIRKIASCLNIWAHNFAFNRYIKKTFLLIDNFD